ncbi:MAG: IS4 family transposase [Opitutaceae bacterium]
MCAFSASLHAPELLAAVRLNPNAFRRNRKLPFVRLLSVLLSGLTASVQNELNVFAANLETKADLRREVSAQAFSKARHGFSHRVFALLNQHLLDLVEQHLKVPRWRGLRLVAADASKLQRFLKDALGRKVREAIAFALYLPGPELSLSFELYSPKMGERQMLFEHLQYLKPHDLLLLDRGYPASWLIARGIHFCMRVDALGFGPVNAFLRSGKPEALVQIAPPSKQDARDYGCPRRPHTVRLVRIVTPNGKTHVVMTSLLDSTVYPAADFTDLYHARWRIEICQPYNLCKSEVNKYHVISNGERLRLAATAIAPFRRHRPGLTKSDAKSPAPSWHSAALLAAMNEGSAAASPIRGPIPVRSTHPTGAALA